MPPSPKPSLSVTDAGIVSRDEFVQNLRTLMPAWAEHLALAPASSGYEVAKSIAIKITTSLQESTARADDLKTTKRLVREASQVGRGFCLLGTSALNNITIDFLRHTATDTSYWTQRLVGEMRSALAGLSESKSTKAALASLVLNYAPKEYITGPNGYRRVAEIFCQGRMQKAYLLMSAVCKVEGVNFKQLGWGASFNGTTKEFSSLRAAIKVGFADLNNYEFTGISGYHKFADSFCQGSMQKAYLLMSAVCKVEGVNFKQLGWGAKFDGPPKS